MSVASIRPASTLLAIHATTSNPPNPTSPNLQGQVVNVHTPLTSSGVTVSGTSYPYIPPGSKIPQLVAKPPGTPGSPNNNVPISTPYINPSTGLPDTSPLTGLQSPQVSPTPGVNQVPSSGSDNLNGSSSGTTDNPYLDALESLFGSSATSSTPESVVGLPVQQNATGTTSTGASVTSIGVIVTIVVAITLYVLYKKGYLKKLGKDV